MKPKPKTVVQGLVFLCLLLQASPVRADDHGNTPGTATVVAVGSVTPGVLEVGGDIDYFVFTVTNAGWHYVTTRGTTDTYGRLFNSTLTQLASDDSNGEGSNFRIVVNL